MSGALVFPAAAARKCRVLVTSAVIVVKVEDGLECGGAMDVVFLVLVLLLFIGMGLYVVAAGKL